MTLHPAHLTTPTNPRRTTLLGVFTSAALAHQAIELELDALTGRTEGDGRVYQWRRHRTRDVVFVTWWPHGELFGVVYHVEADALIARLIR